MESNQFWQLLSRKKQTVFSVIVIALVLALVFAILSPIKYGANSRILVMQKGISTDAYTMSRTNEYLGNLFSQIIYSSSFFDLVMENQNYQIDNNYFSGQQADRLKKWRRTISSRSFADTGIVEINIYHPISEQARQISLAVNDTLTNYGHKYSGSENIEINVIDQPLVSDRPVKPNIVNLIIITVFGAFILSLIYIYIFPEEKYDLKFFNKTKKRKRKENNKKPESIIKDDYIEEKENTEEESQFDLDEYYKSLGKNQDNESGDIDNIVK